MLLTIRKKKKHFFLNFALINFKISLNQSLNAEFCLLCKNKQNIYYYVDIIKLKVLKMFYFY